MIRTTMSGLLHSLRALFGSSPVPTNDSRANGMTTRRRARNHQSLMSNGGDGGGDDDVFSTYGDGDGDGDGTFQAKAAGQ